MVQVCCINHKRSAARDYKHYLQLNPEIIRDITYLGPSSRLINVVESGDIWGLRPNTAWTNTLYESQWCDDVVGVEHVRNNHPERH